MTAPDVDGGRVSPSGLSATAADLRLGAADVKKPTLEEFNAEWRIMGKLGKGAFAEVYKVVLHGSTYALKLLTPDKKGNTEKWIVTVFFREARALKTCNHRNIVAFHGLVKVPPGAKGIGNSAVRWGILQEYCPESALSKKILDSMLSAFGKKYYTELQGLRWSLDIASALAHMHTMECPMLHRDIKTDNILLVAEAGQEMVAKLADFGLHQVIDHKKQPGMFVRRSNALGSRPASQNGSRGHSRPVSARGVIVITASDKARMSDADGHLQPELLESALMARFSRASQKNRSGAERDSNPAHHNTEGGGSSLRGGSAYPPTSGSVLNPLHLARAFADDAGVGEAWGPGGERHTPGRERRTPGRERQTPHLQDALDAMMHEAMDDGRGDLVVAPPTIATVSAGVAAMALPGQVAAAAQGKPPLGGHTLQPRPGGVHARTASGGCDGGADSPGSSTHGAHHLEHLSLAHAPRHMAPGPNFIRISRPSSAAPSGLGSEHVVPAVDHGVVKVETGQVHMEVLDDDNVFSHESVMWQDLEQGDDDALDDADCYEIAYNLTDNQGSRYYMAPEVYLKLPYNQKADVFSFGAVMYEIFSYTVMSLHSESAVDHVKRVAAGWRPPKIDKLPDRLWELIEACMDKDQGARPDMVLVVEQLKDILARVEAKNGGVNGSAHPAGGGGGDGAKSISNAKAPVCGCVIS